MQEELKKNFILLSKIAKEKKYAQEYLGLLARRGDIGSIRIGKRWYTTWQWFEEFLENSKKKKIESVPEVKEIREEFASAIKISIPAIVPVLEKVIVSQGTQSIFQASPAEEKSFVKVRVDSQQTSEVFPQPARNENKMLFIKEPEESEPAANIRISLAMPNQNRVPLKILAGSTRRRESIRPREIEQKVEKELPQKIAFEERSRSAVPFQKVELKKKAGVISPDFSGEEKMRLPVFGRFAFSLGFAMILLLLATSGYFIYSGNLLKSGEVAGASDERSGGFSSIMSEGDFYLSSMGDQMKESLSISQVVVEVAREKQGTVNSKQ